MATKPKVTTVGKEAKRAPSPQTERRRLTPSTTPKTVIVKDNGKAHMLAKTCSTAGELSKHVPNYLKPTVSSKTDHVGKHAVTSKKLQSKDDIHKPNPTLLRRRSFDKPVPVSAPSQLHKSIHSSSPTSQKNTSSAVARHAASSERVAKVVKAVKSQPPLVKTKSLPKTTTRKATTSKKVSQSEEPTHATDIVKSEAQEESLDVNVEEEMVMLESQSPGGQDNPIPPEKQLENIVDNEQQCVAEHEYNDANQDKLTSGDCKSFYHNEKEQEPIVQNVKVNNEDTQVAVEEDQAEDDTEKYEIKSPIGLSLTVKTTPDEVAEVEDQGINTLKEEDQNVIHHKVDNEEEEKQVASAKSESEITGVVHKRHVQPRTRKESPAYNDVIEETASKLVGKRVNKVKALAGAFETVISLEKPHSS